MNRLLRTCSAALLACALSVPLFGLETPLVLPSGNSAGCINAGSGQVIIYEVFPNTTTRKGQANFLTDLQALETRVTMVGEQAYSFLRTGWGPSKDALPNPTPEECLSKWFAKELSPGQKKAGRSATDQEMVRKAEDEFWSKDHPYDGVVRGAFGSFGGGKLMLVVPSKRVAMFYQVDSQDLKLANVYNYSPALYVQIGQNTSPRPDEIASRLDLPKDQKEDLVGQFKQQEDNAALQAAASDVWCCVTSTGFCLLDTANRRMMTFEEKGKAMSLRSVRNISADLAIPNIFQSTPDASDEAKKLAGLYKAMLAEWGVTIFDQYTLKALVGLAQAGGEGARKAEALQANAAGNLVILDFTAQRKLLTYQPTGSNNGIELVTVRDYSFDIASDMLRTRGKARLEAAESFKAIEGLAGKGQAERALAMLKAELKFVPTLVDAAHKSAALKKLAGKDKDALEALLAQGDKDKEAFLAQVKSAVEAAAAEREKAKKDKR
jgi:hypothetical protein